ncbi:phosphoribosyltransferase family protein [Arcobacteraceae bacterium]|nr:phosphoribosyltransferase family protein [Arcobacteraceae bacterium]
MRCLSCQSLSFKIICTQCQDELLKPSFYKRELSKDFFVYSFYKYAEVNELLNTKYEFYGDRVYNILASLSFAEFAKNFQYENSITAIAIDDHTRHDFSHTAILTRHLKSTYIIPKYDLLKVQNQIKYAGKNLEFRKKNKRNFIYKGEKHCQVILVDDIITTGSTLLEAKEILEKNNCEVLFALSISDANI